MYSRSYVLRHTVSVKKRREEKRSIETTEHITWLEKFGQSIEKDISYWCCRFTVGEDVQRKYRS